MDHKAEHWGVESRDLAPITKAEWLAYMEKDPELRRVTTIFGFFRSPFKVAATDAPGCRYEWVSHSCYPPINEKEVLEATDEKSFRKACGDQVHFVLQKSGVSVSCPDDETLPKVRQVAQALGANVIGEDDERY